MAPLVLLIIQITTMDFLTLQSTPTIETFEYIYYVSNLNIPVREVNK